MNTRRWLALATAVLVLAVMNVQILRSENLLAHGRTFYLALAPADPRSIMQGDYMTLNFDLANQLRAAMIETTAQEGEAVITLDSRGVGTAIAVAGQAAVAADTANQLRLHFRRSGWQVLLVTDAYFFEEGQARRFEAARFGEFRGDGSGRALLVALTDEQLRRL